tara:strand:- start:1525 stop:1737 length:213 start_codon:yes stop_codon:yes gene_type:complete
VFKKNFKYSLISLKIRGKQMDLTAKKIKDIKEIFKLVEDLGWDYDKFSLSGQQTYRLIESKIEKVREALS